MNREEMIEAARKVAAYAGTLTKSDLSTLLLSLSVAVAKTAFDAGVAAVTCPSKGRPHKGTCFECGFKGPVHRHHVVPKVLGGTRTVDLCELHHGIVHGLDLTDHSKLIKAGMKKSKKTFGRKVGWRLTKEKFLERHRDAVTMMQRKPDAAIRDIASRTHKSTSTILTLKKMLAA